RKYKITLYLTLLLLSSFWTRPSYGQESSEKQWDNDKQAHAFISAGVSTALYVSFKSSGHSKWSSFLGSFFLTTTLGVVKEVTDKKVSEKDLIADSAGAFAGSLIFLTLDF
ncbi:MAG: hypothetical protein KDD40_05075, partial [Bdellovibrionales bacterium]|nr:hypothetical protein [Bdellovibrionales bacterium]